MKVIGAIDNCSADGVTGFVGGAWEDIESSVTGGAENIGSFEACARINNGQVRDEWSGCVRKDCTC